MKLVIVESPTKAKTISRFLKKGYIVESCMGHIRDLPESAGQIPEKHKGKPWSALGVHIENGFEPLYCIPPSKTQVVRKLKGLLKKASELILATDEDREGESISWHLKEVLKPKVPVKRMVFHEITKPAIEKALKNFRKINSRLVSAQEARRILDRLVGYTLSPLLWKKIAAGLSAGRVQSLAVRLISEREIERLLFVKAEYSSLEGEFLKGGENFKARLQSLKGQKIASGADFSKEGLLLKGKDGKAPLHLTAKEALKVKKQLLQKTFKVQSVETKNISLQPQPPFITSTLQQAANRTLNFSSKQTMHAAQKLYEKGFITYMRTDSTALAEEAIQMFRKIIARSFGKENLPVKARVYKTKSRSAEEAHEAIRPAGAMLSPHKIDLPEKERLLYQLIWQRALASQMKNCEQKRVSAALSAGDSLWSASGTVITFQGFLKVYNKKREMSLLPELKSGNKLSCKSIECLSHESRPPSRYNEASLIQKLEEEGVGRPSTYSPTISAIQDRGYIKKEGKALAPTWTALAVTDLLRQNFPDYVDLKFTSRMESVLDDIALGRQNAEKYLSQIYKGKKGLKAQVEAREKKIDPKTARQISLQPFGKNISLHVGRYGAYAVQKGGKKELKTNLPNIPPADLNKEELCRLLQSSKAGDKILGRHPETKEKILLKYGRYGPYLELEKTKKRAAVPGFLKEEISLKRAVELLKLPEVLGLHPETGKEVKKSIGRYGPYAAHDGHFRSLAADESFFKVDLKTALQALARPKTFKRSVKALKELKGKEGVIQVLSGKYGPYLKFQNKNAGLPKGLDWKDLTFKEGLSFCKKRKKKK